MWSSEWWNGIWEGGLTSVTVVFSYYFYFYGFRLWLIGKGFSSAEWFGDGVLAGDSLDWGLGFDVAGFAEKDTGFRSSGR